MSEDDRAAKAARAKALLKKRQQKKVTESIAAPSGSEVASPASPSRTFSPAPPEPKLIDQQDAKNLGDIFTNKDTSDTSWISSLPRVASPPPPVSHVATSTVHRVSVISPSTATISSEPPPKSTLSPSNIVALQNKLDALSKENESLAATVSRLQNIEAAAQQADASLAAERKRVEDLQRSYQQLQDDMEATLQNEHRTVSLLVSEKTHLTAELQKLENLPDKVQELDDLLEAERTKSESLSKQTERELQINAASTAELRKEADEAQRKLRELEEQIQSDDRVERLEISLKHAQDHAGELEFQLTKLKQVHTSLKSEKGALDDKVSEISALEAELRSKVFSLDASLLETRDKLSGAEKEKAVASQEISTLQELTQTLEVSIKEHQEKLDQAITALATTTRQVQTTQTELKNAIRRAEDAERTQKTLQAEGVSLMRSLDEMRPKIVELTGAKLDLAEKVESLEHTLRGRDSFISQLENDLGEAREQLEQVENNWKSKLAEQEKKHREIQNGNTDIQKAYADLQEEMDTALASLRNLESQRTTQHQEAARRLEEVERLTNLTHAQGEELDALRKELDARTKAHDEEQDYLEHAQNEIETLRNELSAREHEIEELREIVNTPVSDAPRSLDNELLSSIRQQHAIEISAATSQIRALENTIFDKESVNHKLQKQLNALEEQIVQLRATNSRLKSSPMPSRPASRAVESSDLRRASFGSHRPSASSQALLSSRTMFDRVMSPETLHKRKVSLSMLKARIESEAQPPPPSRTLSPVHSETGHSHSNSHSRHSSLIALGHPSPHRSQFLDESHVFWCSSCHGDLVIL
ncbi:hypothetical protein BDN70DRAFT_926625 [Pholiota conissans]|uniref:Uncharacterized protein n=1 Tax=Pholiota conissans TaxID=109636 RepID=A0A9P5ZF96_9AGAR|nr:hypothetical protein BDN70DRAFT_926625 [Pholiota conissans]